MTPPITISPIDAKLKALEEALEALPAQDIPDLVGGLERLKTKALLKVQTQGNGAAQAGRNGPALAGGDRLLTVKEAATRMGMSQDWVYRNAPTLPFTVKVGSRVRFSERGLERWVAKRQGMGNRA